MFLLGLLFSVFIGSYEAPYIDNEPGNVQWAPYPITDCSGADGCGDE